MHTTELSLAAERNRRVFRHMLSYTRVTPAFCDGGYVCYVFEKKLIVRQFQDDISELVFALDLSGIFSQRVRCIEWRPRETTDDLSLLVASSDEVRFYSIDGRYLGQISPEFGVATAKWVTPDHVAVISPNSLVADIYWIEPTLDSLGINHVIRVTGPKTTNIHVTEIDNYPVVNFLTRVGVHDSLTRVTIKSALEVTVDSSSTFLHDTPGEFFKCSNGLFALAENPALGHKVCLYSTSGHLLSDWEGSAIATLPFNESILSSLEFCSYEQERYLASGSENVVSILSLRHLQPMKVLVQSILVTRDIFYLDCWLLSEEGYQPQSTPYAPYSIVGANSSSALTPSEISYMACSPHGYIAIVCSLTPTTVWIWSIQDTAPVVHTVLCHAPNLTITTLSWHPEQPVLMTQFGHMSSVWDMAAGSGNHFPYRVKWLPRGMLLYDGQEFGLA